MTHTQAHRSATQPYAHTHENTDTLGSATHKAVNNKKWFVVEKVSAQLDSANTALFFHSSFYFLCPCWYVFYPLCSPAAFFIPSKGYLSCWCLWFVFFPFSHHWAPSDELQLLSCLHWMFLLEQNSYIIASDKMFSTKELWKLYYKVCKRYDWVDLQWMNNNWSAVLNFSWYQHSREMLTPPPTPPIYFLLSYVHAMWLSNRVTFLYISVK